MLVQTIFNSVGMVVMCIVLPLLGALDSCCALRRHKGMFKDFSCGKLYYKVFHLDHSRETLYVGAMDKVFKLNVSDISRADCERDALTLDPTKVQNCVAKGKSEEYECRNHIRVIQPIGDGSQLYICGTNAHNPADWVIYNNLSHLKRDESVPGIGSGVARCPFDPADNNTAIWVETGNPDNLPGLYSGTVAEFTKADTVIFRTDLYDKNMRVKHLFKRTLKYDSKWLDRTNFVGSFDIGDYVFFFFRETAVEYINCGKIVYSRVARVCKHDTGGKNILNQNWATYLKARLNCSIPGEFPFYFNEIQNVFQMPNNKDRFFATFSTSPSGLPGSAICSFHIDDIQAAFNGRFKEQASSSSAWLPVLSGVVPDPRPGQCVNDTQTLPDTVLNFIRSHPLMDEAVAHEHGQPVFYQRNIVFTRLVVDIVKVGSRRDQREVTAYYAGTDDGKVYKIVQWVDNQRKPHCKLLDVIDVVTPESISAMEISSEHKSMYVASNTKIRQVSLQNCKGYQESCTRCVTDPYCGWDTETLTCQPYSYGMVQDLYNSGKGICPDSIQAQRLTLTWGKAFYMGCPNPLDTLVEGDTYWIHTVSEGHKYQVESDGTTTLITADGGLVILSAGDQNVGLYTCNVGMHTLAAYNVTIDSHKCNPPRKAQDYKKIYLDWCNEFQKYKSAMQHWERRQQQCSRLSNT